MTAVEKLLTDHLDLWAAAIKRKSTAGRGSASKVELYGIKKLRALILELAVRGLLVPQDPNDEPAIALLKKIAAEKAKLVKEGQIKPDKPLPMINTEELPHYIPVGWAYERFGRLAIIERGGSPRPIQSYLTDQPDGLNWIKIGDTDIGGKYITATKEKIIKEGLNKTRMVYPGDFLLTNSMSFGRPYITKIEGCIHDGWLRISPAEQVDKDFLYLLLSSPYIVKSFTASAAGAVVQNLNSDKVREVLILLPPLTEQHRIVAKVDELMALCDQLEQQTDASLSAHQTLVETLLHVLTSAADHAQFASSWQRIAEHFDTLFTTEESIALLKQTILQLAVMGKLVSQDPNDEPASELLKKIAAEKAKLVKEGKIKKDKPPSKIDEREKPFELPPKWEWSRLTEISANVHYGYTASSNESIRSVRLLRITDIQDDVVNWDGVPGCEIEADKIAQYQLVDDDILIARTGGTIGKSYLVQGITVCAVFASYLIRVRHLKGMSARYKKIYLGSQLYWLQLYAKSMGTGQPNVNGESLKGLVVPVPPLAEQHRIVAKVYELMALCDQLKSRLSDAQTTQLHLADAIVEQAIC